MCTDIGAARYTFDCFGYAPEGTVSPMILRSWERSRHLPIEIKNTRLPAEVFEKILRENEAYMKFALPIEQLLFVCSGAIVCLYDKELYVLHQISREAYINQLSCSGKEEAIGTSAASLCVMEGMPVQTVRQENYALRYQHCSTAAAPIYDVDGVLKGVVSIVTAFGRDLPSGSLDMTGNTAKLIEKRMSGDLKLSYGKCQEFSHLLNSSLNPIAVVDRHKNIVFLSDSMKNATGISSVYSYKNRSIFDLCEEPSKLSYILKSESDNSEGEIVKFKNFETRCLRMEHIDFGAVDGVLTVVAFEPENKSKIEQAARKGQSITGLRMKQETKVALIGESPAWLRIKTIISKVAAVHSTRVLIEGESGSGKEQVAKAIHEASGRKGNMITINCGAIPKELLQSELFGYADGAFTGAKRGGNPGKFEMANGGTLFLDEIGEMPFNMQVSLLRVLEEKQVTRLGSSTPIPLDVTVLAATNKCLLNEVSKGNFREDLYYRLSTIVISVPPLRQRKSDIPNLTKHLMKRLTDSLHISPHEITEDALKLLIDYDWPGNVRELLNVLEHALIVSDDCLITAGTIREVMEVKQRQFRSIYSEAGNSEPKKLSSTRQSRRDLYQVTIDECGGNISAAAKKLNVSRNTVYRYIKGKT